MAKLTEKPNISLNVNLTLTEAELRALHFLSSYGVNLVIEAFAGKVSESELRDYTPAILSFFTCIRSEFPLIDSKIKDARYAFNPPKEIDK